MKLTPKMILKFALPAILTIESVVGTPGIEPQVSEEIEPDVRQAFIAFINAYNRGDGATAYEYLDTSLERSVLIEGLRITPIPLLDFSVYGYDADTLNLAYDLPHPGDILAAIQDGGDNPGTVSKNIGQLRYGDDFTRRFETWHVIRDRGRIKFFFNNNGFLNLAARIGGQVDYYITGPDKQTLDSSSFPGIPLENRMLIMLLTYFESYDIEIKSVEGKRVLKEIAAKIKTLPQTTPKVTPKAFAPDNVREISTPEITMKIPKTWINQTRKLRQSNPTGIAYTFDNHKGDPIILYFTKELDTRQAPEFRNKTDRQILDACCLLNRTHLTGKLLNFGDLTIDGSPAAYFLEHVKSDHPDQRVLTYLVVRDGVLYNLKFLCYKASFDAYFDLFETIKDSLRFRD